MLAGLGALVMASSVFVLSAPTATAAGTDKVFVCKFVNNGDREILQTGTNPISVSVSAIAGADQDTDAANLVNQSFFNDRQERSLVIAVDDTPPGPAGDPDVSACQPRSPEVVVPTPPSTTDICGPGNIAFVVPADTGQLNFESINGTVTVAPQPGFMFAGDSQLVTYTLPADSGALCTSTVVIPAQPATTDPCGPANIAFVVPADTDQLDFTLLSNKNVTVAPKPGFVFEGASQLVTFTLPADSRVLCAGQQGGVQNEVLGEEASNNNGSNNGGNNNGGGSPEVLGAQASANNAPAPAVQQSAPASAAAQVPTVINAGTAGEAPANPLAPAAIALFGALMGLIALGMRGGLARVGGGKA